MLYNSLPQFRTTCFCPMVLSLAQYDSVDQSETTGDFLRIVQSFSENNCMHENKAEIVESAKIKNELLGFLFNIVPLWKTSSCRNVGTDGHLLCIRVERPLGIEVRQFLPGGPVSFTVKSSSSQTGVQTAPPSQDDRPLVTFLLRR